MDAFTVSDIISAMEAIAPSYLAEAWDNVGLQVGCRSWPVEKVWVALDPSPAVIHKACEQKIDLLLTHHPLFFKPIKNIDVGTSLGKCLADCIREKLSIYSAHTNYDSVYGGLNDVFAARIGLQACRALEPAIPQRNYKLVIVLPRERESDILNLNLGQGPRIAHIPEKNHLLRRDGGPHGREKPSLPKNEDVGLKNRLFSEIAVVIDENSLANTVADLKSLTYYAELNYEVYPMAQLSESRHGIGRVGSLPASLSLRQLASVVKKSLGVPAVRMVGHPDLIVNDAAVCTGSGGSLLKAFFASSAQVYITGDIKYHEAMDILDAGKGMIDVGHFASEVIMVDNIVERLRIWANKFTSRTISIEPCRLEHDPFSVLAF
jgi:dinuclear metal center YbgI/SA1388 family protein